MWFPAVSKPITKTSCGWAIWHQIGRLGLIHAVSLWNFTCTTILSCPSRTGISWIRYTIFPLDRPWLKIFMNFSVIFYHIIAHSSAHYVWILINDASTSCPMYLLLCNTSMNTIDTIQLLICKVLHPHPKTNWEWAIWHQSGRPGLKALFLAVPSWNFSFTTIWLCPS